MRSIEMLGWVLAVGVGGVAAGALVATAPITFDEITASSGVRFVTKNAATPEKHQPEMMVGGVAVLDYDADGYPDLYFVNGATMPGLAKPGSEFSNRLFHNNRDLTFTDVTEKAGVEGSGYGMGASVGDFDNDGRPDLYVTAVNGNQLFHNNGDGTFTDVTARAGVGGGMHDGRKMWSASAAWIDYNNDGLLDLFVSNYCEWDPATEHACVMNGARVYCNPRFYKPLPATLYRNNGDGTFTDVSVEVGLVRHPGRGMGIAIADYDGDGFMDIYVANDAMPGQLFHNMKGHHFEEVGQDAMVAYPEEGAVISGMGVDFRDVFNTGRPDLWVTAMEKETFPLFVANARGEFADDSVASGLGRPTSQMSGWSNAIVDLDNDGWKDLLVARSNVLDNVALFSTRRFDEPNAVFHNLGNGRFEDVSLSAGKSFQVSAVHRGLAVADLDNDGRMDAVFTVLNGGARLLHNSTANQNHWILLQLSGTKSNRMGIGARITLIAADGSKQFNHVTTASGYASSSDVRVHFGLGLNSSVRRLQIAWPSGVVQTFTNLHADQILQVVEPK